MATDSRLDGPARAALYAVLNQTGLSWAKVGALRIGMFDLEHQAINLRFRYKNAIREETHTLTKNAVTVMWVYLDLRIANPMAKAFYLPSRSAAEEMLQHDLECAGLPYIDDEGRIFDFTALKKRVVDW